MSKSNHADIETVAVELARLVREEQLVELTFENDKHRLRMRSRRTALVPETAPPAAVEELVPAVNEELGGTPVTSSVVGVFHQGDRVTAEPLVRVGARIHQGQVLCYIESMGLNHEVRAPIDGTVLEILASQGEPVEYGQALMLVDSH
ncbi:MAG: hypothetical protein HY319_22090 [Armatimonadetes bacterium]|nr:hypothetical protein [Armatimonadota bacterium]